MDKMENLYLEDFPGTKYLVNLIKEDEETDAIVPVLSGPQQVFEYIGLLRKKDRECMVAILLNAKNIPLGVTLVAVGTLTSCPAHPREIFKAAILGSAASIILAHNHPSGDPVPSDEDKKLTDRVKKVGELLGIPLRDHLIVGRHCYYSFQERGM